MYRIDGYGMTFSFALTGKKLRRATAVSPLNLKKHLRKPLVEVLLQEGACDRRTGRATLHAYHVMDFEVFQHCAGNAAGTDLSRIGAGQTVPPTVPAPESWSKHCDSAAE